MTTDLIAERTKGYVLICLEHGDAAYGTLPSMEVAKQVWTELQESGCQFVILPLVEIGKGWVEKAQKADEAPTYEPRGYL